ncbi:flavonol 7-O-beta-glucosyltransferase UGT74F1-like isoform X1 [Coffea eugenioides]|uniref:flavonol 7-O-beta-glucosyltransferase UGT74F1-like isoform X1 n=1 Tax=Coffea eugenioides TaxID=49369 RepID=UPI000F614018|nr:flavonol 7-O-beta-glucosyltransferase UGT74F1-like isoform X1 [Coffea eugenioides]
MENREKQYKAHVLAIPFQSAGHINPMLQLCKKLVRKGLKATLTITKFTSKVSFPKSDKVQIDIISDGYDEGGFFFTDPVPISMARFKEVGSQSILELLKKYESLGTPIDFIIYDSLLPFVLDLCKEIGLPAVASFTHQCGVNYIMHQFSHGKLTNPVTEFPVLIPGLPPLEHQDLPYFGSNIPYHFAYVCTQFSNVNQADYVLVNTFYELEKKVVDEFSKHLPVLTVGPTVPTFYLDRRVVDDKEYGIASADNDPSTCLNWLNSKPARSVIYASLSSVRSASFGEKQLEELALALKNSNYHFLWSVKHFEAEKLPKNFKEEASDRGLLVPWTPQLEVLSSEAVGCILSHCGWNSTLEAISLGVPIVAMPQFIDQQPNAKFIQDVWKVGIRVKHDRNGLATREEIGRCIKEVMEGEAGKEIKENAMKFSNLAKEAVSEGGSSDTNLNYFVSKMTSSS